MSSNMVQKYIHYIGNESSESLLEAYGVVTNNNFPIDRLSEYHFTYKGFKLDITKYLFRNDS